MDQIKKGIEHLKKVDKVMKDLIEKYGEFYIPEEDLFTILCESIIAQQLSSKVADVISKRLREFCCNNINPHKIAEESEENLRKIGLSNQKIKYIKMLSESIVKGELNLNELKNMPNEDVIKSLTRIKGIGKWTAEMFLIFGLRRLDVLPYDDFGIRKAIQIQYNLGEIPDKNKIMEIGQKWHPYETIASWYLWRSLENR